MHAFKGKKIILSLYVLFPVGIKSGFFSSLSWFSTKAVLLGTDLSLISNVVGLFDVRLMDAVPHFNIQTMITTPIITKIEMHTMIPITGVSSKLLGLPSNRY